MLIRMLSVVFCLFMAFPLNADEPQSVAANVIADWEDWMARHSIPAGAIVISYNGDIVGEGRVDRTVDEPAKVASLSKAITAVCVLKALGEAGLGPTVALKDVIPDALAAHPPRDARFSEITVEQLMTHASGIETDYHRTELGKLRTFTEESKLWQFSKIVDIPLSGTPAWASYRYANANYLVLGLVIEEVTEEPYEPYCQRVLFAASDLTSAQLNPEWRVMSSWGGWEISARDYLIFAHENFTVPYSPLRPAGVALSAAEVGRGRSYGAGMVFRSRDGGFTTWHLGSWRGVRGRVTDLFGAYVAIYDNGYAVVTNYAHDAWDREISGELDSLLFDGMNR